MLRRLKNPALRFALHIWALLGLLGLAGALLVFYTMAEERLSEQRQIRITSLELSDELRQSSDDITRMVRTYIVTGDKQYKEYTREIIDIRDGKRPRPVEYNKVYWDLVLKDDQRPTPMAEPTPLLERMRAAGFTVKEFEKLVEAKDNSDQLTHREFSAIELIESQVPVPEPNRTRAAQMVHDAQYHEAKAKIMRPIRDFEVMMDRRTQNSIQDAETAVFLLRGALVLVGLLIGYTLWATRRNLRTTLGATVPELYRVAGRVESAGAVQALPAAAVRTDSVLGRINQTHHHLAALEQSSSAAEKAQRNIERRFYDLAEASGDWIWEVDQEWVFTFVSENALTQLDFQSGQILGKQILDLVPQDDRQLIAERLAQISSAEASFRDLEIPLAADSGFVHTTLSSGNPLTDHDGQLIGFRGIVRDVTAERQHQEQLRIVATAFETLEPLVITDADGVIVKINRALTDSMGHTVADLHGKTIAALLATRHESGFFAELWASATRHGMWQGEVWVQRKNTSTYPGWLSVAAVVDEDDQPTHYVCTYLDLTERKDAENKVAKLAYFDQLTGLPNRTMFLDRLKQAMTTASKTGVYGALLLIDLDHFKTLNDTRGHAIGDQLLNDVAHRLTKCLKRESFVARLGGDEFVVLLPNLSSLETEARIRAEGAAEQVLTTLRQPFQLDNTMHFSTQSIGMAVYLGMDVPVDRLMRHVDLAMYDAKSHGRDSYAFFDPAMENAADRKAVLEQEIRQGLSDGHFTLAYQPQVGPDGLVFAVEALLRWDNPDWQEVPTNEVIAIAETSGLIVPLGIRVLEMACAQLRDWARNPALAHLGIAVNVSARQLAERDFVEQVQAVLTRTGIQANQLKLEVTESVFIDEVEEAIEKLRDLKNLGFSIALDDFGTGYSSMAYLQKLPLDQLKIDRSFVSNVLHDTNAAAIVRTIINLGENLGVQVVAEGIETVAQRNAITKLGCYAWQGYLLSGAVPAGQLADVISRAVRSRPQGTVELPKSRRINISESEE